MRTVTPEGDSAIMIATRTESTGSRRWTRVILAGCALGLWLIPGSSALAQEESRSDVEVIEVSFTAWDNETSGGSPKDAGAGAAYEAQSTGHPDVGDSTGQAAADPVAELGGRAATYGLLVLAPLWSPSCSLSSSARSFPPLSWLF